MLCWTAQILILHSTLTPCNCRAEEGQGLGGLGGPEAASSFLSPRPSWRLRTQAEFQQLHGQPAPAGSYTHVADSS